MDAVGARSRLRPQRIVAIIGGNFPAATVDALGESLRKAQIAGMVVTLNMLGALAAVGQRDKSLSTARERTVAFRPERNTGDNER